MASKTIYTVLLAMAVLAVRATAPLDQTLSGDSIQVPIPDPPKHYGKGVAVSGDGQYLIVVSADDHWGAGSAWSYKANAGGGWDYLEDLTQEHDYEIGSFGPGGSQSSAQHKVPRSHFGMCVTMNHDGSRVVISAGWENEFGRVRVGYHSYYDCHSSPTAQYGAFYVYERNAGGYLDRVSIYYVDDAGTPCGLGAAAHMPQFGRACAMSADGSVLAVGADRDEPTLDKGALWFFQWNSGAGHYEEIQKVPAGSMFPGATGGNFGASIAMTSDASTVVVGAYTADAIAVFTRNPADGSYSVNYTFYEVFGSDSTPSDAFSDHYGRWLAIGDVGPVIAVTTRDYVSTSDVAIVTYDHANLQWITKTTIGIKGQGFVALSQDSRILYATYDAGATRRIGAYYSTDPLSGVYSQKFTIASGDPVTGFDYDLGFGKQDGCSISADGSKLVVSDQSLDSAQGRAFSYRMCVPKLSTSTDYVDWTGTTYTLACASGYPFSSGVYTQDCSTTAPLVCGVTGCSDPGTVTHATRTGTFNDGDVVYWTCDGGYIISGASAIQCNSGLWNTTGRPTCTASPCSDPGTVTHGTPTGTWNDGDVVYWTCDPNYVISAPPSAIQCHAGTWNTTSRPTCTAITCSDSGCVRSDGDVSFSTGSPYLVGATVSLTCHADFAPVNAGLVSATCTAAGTWSQSLTTCVATNCSTPPPATHGHYVFIDLRLGHNTVYACDGDYATADALTIACGASQTWSAAAPVCATTNCSALTITAPLLAVTYSERLNEGITFACAPYYQLSGGASINCEGGNVWSGGLPSCLPTNCSVWSVAAPLRVLTEDRKLNDVVTFACDADYIVSGSPTSTCGAGQTWTPASPPSCITTNCSVLTATTPLMLNSAAHRLNDVVVFSCAADYKLVGSAALQCMAGMSWNTSAPTCALTNCSDPGTPAHGLPISTDWRTGHSVTYACETDYYLLGGATRLCTDTTWSGSTPTCQPSNCSDPGTPAHGQPISTDWRTGHYVAYACDADYRLNGGDAVRLCTNAVWNGTLPSCVPSNCSALSMPTNGNPISDARRLGNIVSFTCQPTFNLIGSSALLCTVSGWNASAPVCSSSPPCPAVAPTASYTTDCQSSSAVNAVCTLSCKAGYSGATVTRTCQNGGSWDSNTTPTCTLITCPATVAPANGALSGVDNTLPGGSSATVSCVTGYTLHGDSVRTCSSAGTWQGVAPSCAIVTCPATVPPVHGALDGTDDATYGGQAAAIKCDAGYALVDGGARICLASGNWSGPDPHCEPVSCPANAAPDHGFIDGADDLRVGGHSAPARCHPGFALVGDAVRTCDATGVWIGVPPSCTQLHCPTTYPPVNGYAVGNDENTPGGASATVRCSSGYDLIGDATLTCSDNGTWAGTPPRCQASAATAALAPPPPAILDVAPRSVPQLGAAATVSGRGWTLPLMSMTVGTETVSPANLTYQTGDGSVAAVLTLPGQPNKGYASVSVEDATGLHMQLDDTLFFSDDCPHEGQYGQGTDCHACPANAVCPGGYRVWPLPGYWNSGEQSDAVLACDEPTSRCQGGRTSPCAEGYRGDRCSSCDEGYFNRNGECVACGPKEDQTILFIVNGVLFFMMAMAFCFLNDLHLGYVIEVFKALQLLRASAKASVGSLPGVVKDIYNYMSIMTFDYDFLRPDCAGAPISFREIFWGNLIIVGLLAAPPLIFMTVMAFVRPKRREFYQHRMVRTVVIIVTLIYFIMCTRVLQAVNCVGGKLTVDGITKCYNPGSADLQSVGWLGVFLFCLMTPAVMGFYLLSLHRRNRLDDPIVMARFGFLYDTLDYSHHLSLIFAVIPLVHMLVLAVAWSILSASFFKYALCSMSFLLVVICVFVLRPYATPFNNLLAMLSYSAGFVSSIVNLMASPSVGSDFYTILGAAVGTGVILLIVSLVIFFRLLRSHRNKVAPMNNYVLGDDTDLDTTKVTAMKRDPLNDSWEPGNGSGSGAMEPDAVISSKRLHNLPSHSQLERRSSMMSTTSNGARSLADVSLLSESTASPSSAQLLLSRDSPSSNHLTLTRDSFSGSFLGPQHAANHSPTRDPLLLRTPSHLLGVVGETEEGSEGEGLSQGGNSNASSTNGSVVGLLGGLVKDR